MTEPNFEAMGRHQHALTQVRSLTDQRLAIIREIKRWAERCETWARDYSEFCDIETVSGLDKIDKLTDLNSKLADAVTECNLWAEQARAQRIRIRQIG